MPRNKPQPLVYLGIRNTVVAVDKATGAEVWRVKLKGMSFLAVFRDADALYASASGEVWRLDPASGAVLWHAPLKGLGTGLVSLVSDDMRPEQQRAGYVSTAEAIRQQQAAAAAAG